MKKKIISITAMLSMMLFPMLIKNTQAQIFIDDADLNQRSGGTNMPSSLPSIPQLDVTFDQYAPLGDEILLLGCLGGAYLFGKKHRKSKV